MEWLLENEDYINSRGHSKDRVVFYSTGSNGQGENMAYDFVDNDPSYAVFDFIFGSKFSKNFGRLAPREGNVGKATSTAFAQWSKNPFVFNTKSGEYSLFFG
jgi:hypothetical protein